ncbi:MAG: T9SS type A sorting domain-containing protein [FCB group bacterium]
MMKNYIFSSMVLFCCLFLIPFNSSFAESIRNKSDKNDDRIQRVIPYKETRNSTKSNILFKVKNTGINFYDNFKTNGHGGCLWPRGTQNSYIFGQGICFAAKKNFGGDINKLVTMSYNPHVGVPLTTKPGEGLVPGRIEDGSSGNSNYANKYQVYLSTDYNSITGAPLDTNNTTLDWPLWKDKTGDLNKFGIYVYNETERDALQYHNGPAFVSDEDIHCDFKDTDVDHYNLGNPDDNASIGFPMGIQYEETIYSWGTGDHKDMLMIYYKLINTSTDALTDCWIAPVIDPDLMDNTQNDSTQTSNDVSKYYSPDTTLNLGVTWTGTDKGELGKGFGYLGISLLMTPAVNSNGILRRDKPIYDLTEQLGLKTFLLFSIDQDSATIINNLYDNLYNNISSGLKTLTSAPSDIRLLLSTGPFNMMPVSDANPGGDTARLILLINFAQTSKGGEADGTFEDMQKLVDGVKLARTFFYNDLLVKVIENENSLKNKFGINELYPNPANDEVLIDFNTSSSGNISIDIYNLMGQKVKAFQPEYYDAGQNTGLLSLNNLTAGSYYIRLNWNGKVDTKMLTIIK